MNTLSSTEFGNWTASKVVSDTDQISSYLEENFARKDRSLSITGNLIAGEGNVSYGNNCSLIGSNLSTITDSCFAIGSGNVAGTNGFKMESFVSAQNLIVISGDANQLSDLSNAIGQKYSFQVTKPTGMIRINHGTVLSVIDHNKLSVDELPLSTQLDTSGYRDLWFVNMPKLGTGPYGDSGFAEGYSNKALGYGSHAEGYNNIAGSKYSHVEGRDNIAGYCAHAEGQNCIAAGNRSHAEGYKTYALNPKDSAPANASGVEVSAIGNYARAAGFRTLVSADNAFGWNGDVSRTIDDPYVVSSDGAFAINPKNGILGLYIGNQTIVDAFNEYLHVPGIYATGTYVIDREKVKYSEEPDSPCQIISTHVNPVITKIASDTVLSIADGQYKNTTEVSGFALSSKLKEVYLPQTKYIGTAAFYYSMDLESVYAPKLEHIGERSFTNCRKMQSLTCYSLSSISSVPFDNCWMMSSIVVDNDNWESRHNNQIIVDKTQSPEKIVLLVQNVPEFEDYSIYDVGARICYGSTGAKSYRNISSFILPNVNAFAGSETFATCRGLAYVNISNIKTISKQQHFINCNALQTIDFSDREDHATVPTLENSNTFTKIGNDTYKIVVPDDMVEMWKAAPRWSDVAEHIFGKSEVQ